MKTGKKLKSVILVLVLASALQALKAKRDEKVAAIPLEDYKSEDFEDTEISKGSEEAVVKAGMKQALEEGANSTKKHKKETENHQKNLKEYDNLKNQSKDWLEKLKNAKNREEYEQILKGYQNLVKNF